MIGLAVNIFTVGVILGLVVLLTALRDDYQDVLSRLEQLERRAQDRNAADESGRLRGVA